MECLNQMLARNARHLPEKDFLISGDRHVTYGEFDRRTSRLAHVLEARGVRKGDPVGLYLPSDIIMAEGFWACQKIGAIPVPLAAMYRESELRNVMRKTEMAVLVAHASTYPVLAPLRREFAHLTSVLVAGGALDAESDLDALIAAASDAFAPVECSPEDIAALFFTSGTTGLPKGTMQRQRNQYSGVRDMAVSHRTQFAKEIYLCASPLFNNLGMTVHVNLCMYTGGTVVLVEKWDTETILSLIGKHRVTHFGGIPTMFIYMLNGFDPARHDLSSLRYCYAGGTPVSQVMMERFEKQHGVKVLQVYGATESSCQNVAEPFEGVRKSGSAGIAIGSSRVLIVDDNRRILPPDEVGEVALAGDCVAAGYWRDPEATAAVFSDVGWLSGDIGRIDEDGYLYIVDRKKDVIISGGHNIYPLEIEELLYRHESVAMCAVVGVPEEARGEIPVGVVVRKPGVDVSGAELIAWCRANVAAYKAPRHIYFIDEMPMGNNKIRKRELVDGIVAGTIAPAA